MHAFGLVETGACALAEERADVALTLQSQDIWAVNAMALVYQMEVSPLRYRRIGGVKPTLPVFLFALFLRWGFVVNICRLWLMIWVSVFPP